MAGYWQNPEATAATLRGGWLHTGDVGVFDAEGYLHLKDRSKDMIISGGSNIYPREVEEVLLTHAAVREVSVIGRPDREWGEVVVAYVVGEASARRARRAVPLPHCALQAAEGLCFCRRAAEEQLRQDPQDRTARDGRTKDQRHMNEMTAKPLPARCPLCGKPTDQAFKPFCSKRCADIDLNRWLSGVYAVPAKEGRRRGRRAARARARRANHDAPVEWPDRLFAALKRADMRQVGYVPDAGHSRLIERCRADPGYPRRGAHHRGGGRGARRRRLARRRSAPRC